MKKCQVFLLPLIFCFCFHSAAQEIETTTPEKIITVKAYANFLYFDSDYNPMPYDFDKLFFRFWGITPSVIFRKEGSRTVHEFEPKFWFSTRDDNNIKEYEIGLRYELNWYLKKDIFPGLQFRWGPAIRGYYYNADVSRGYNGPYPIEVNAGGLELSMGAHLEYRLSKNLILDLSTSNFNVNFGVDFHYHDHPDLTERQKKNGGFDFAFFNQQLMRLGIGYEF